MSAPRLRISFSPWPSLAIWEKINQFVDSALGMDDEITENGRGMCKEVIMACCLVVWFIQKRYFCKQ